MIYFIHEEMTQQELADKVGVTRQTIVALEAGNYNPSLVLALRIAKYFGVTVETVFDSQNEEFGNITG